jgi:DNA-binding IclR family transcriptional regulator
MMSSTELLEHPREQLAAHSGRLVHDAAELAAQVARLTQEAAEGIAYSRDAYKRGASAVAVPIFSQGVVVAALGLVVPTERFDAKVDEYSRELRAAAAEMGRRLDAGFRPAHTKM